MLEITANHVAHYIITHTLREQVFPGWHNDQIMHTVINHMRDDEVLVVTVENAICGVLIFDETSDPSVIRVDSILVSHSDVLAMFVSLWFRRYPNKSLIARRHGRAMKYTPRNFRRLLGRLAPIVKIPANVNYAICDN